MDVKVAYSFIESILTQGFLSLGLKCGDNFIVFKTLTEKEYRNLKYLCPVGDEKLEKIIRLSLSTFMINSENMLINRNDKIEVLKDFYSNLPLMAIKLLLDNITTLHTKYISSLRYFEGFCYTDKSRYLWKTLSNSDPTTCSFSGIEGTENCGMNLVQENWVNINNKFDEEEIYERDFNLSLMISSSMNPKGSKAISISYKNSRDEIEDVRSQIAHYGYDKKRYVEERKASKWSKPIKTREDLVRELEKQIRGEKDHHDLFIEQWVKEQKRMAEEARNSIAEKQTQYRKKLEEMDLSAVEGSRLASPEEVKYLSQRAPGNGVLTNLGEEFLRHENKQAFIKKVSSVILKSENKD